MEILELDVNDVRCVYCGDKTTEWDHLRPLVSKKKPTGYISEIRNLVPACGKCNQSKGNKYWKDWINSDAKQSPKTRCIKELGKRIQRLERYERWGNVVPIDLAELVDRQLWERHWENCTTLHQQMQRCQQLAEKIKKQIEKRIRSSIH